MANRIQLLHLKDAPAPGPDGHLRLVPNEDEFLREASDCLPLFWASLFNLSEVHESEHSGDRYPLLVAPRAQAVARSRVRCEVIAKMLPAGAGDCLRAWLGVLDGLRGQALAVETLELWAMDPENFFDGLAELLSWVADPRLGSIRSIRMLTGIETDRSGKIRSDDALSGSLLGYE